ncbi:MAG: tripartite tricarboxylate transporter substrate binding protein [Acetobacteraceae bacterium]|nr:tripartite tricarboxylate transporter substrate binding protein [Acetobacteraceae bacterium]
MPRRRSIIAATLLAAPGMRAARAQQPAWPAGRPVRVVVGFAPGGAGDTIARTLAEPLGRELGATILVDNRPGAGSNIAAEHVARSEPDGYTLLLGGASSHGVNPALYRRLSFDAVADFTPITQISDQPLIVAVRADRGISTLAELGQRMRAQPGRWNFASSGTGTPSHLVGVVLGQAMGVEIVHVPFRGGALALQAVLAGDVELLVTPPTTALGQIRGGTLRGLTLSSRANSAVIPEVPGSAAAGLPALDMDSWWGVWGPARLPAPIRDRVFAALAAVLAQPGVRTRLAQEGQQAMPSASPEAFDRFIRAGLPVWAEIVRTSGATAE